MGGNETVSPNVFPLFHNKLGLYFFWWYIAMSPNDTWREYGGSNWKTGGGFKKLKLNCNLFLFWQVIS